MSRAVDELVELISEMPGIGPRQAKRIVQFLLRTDGTYKSRLSKKIQDISSQVTQCTHCFRYDEVNENKLCVICANGERDTGLLMVVEKDVDIESVEAAGIFNGNYFVLGGLMPLARQRKNKVAPRTTALHTRIKNAPHIEEIILAFATTPEGDFTVQEISTFLKENVPAVKVSMLGRGLSLGAEIEYADQETLKNAFQGRH